MHPALQPVVEKSVKLVKKDSRCVGAWYFGSTGRGVDDAWSDADIVFLIRAEAFTDFADEIPEIMRKSCEEVLHIWPEDYNNDSLRNYGCVLYDKGQVLQYDFFIMNEARTDEHFCRVHYETCLNSAIIYDPEGKVADLFTRKRERPLPEDPLRLIASYWYHAVMSVKYWQRTDPFKLAILCKYLYNIHARLLLTVDDRIDWGSVEAKVVYGLTLKQRETLCGYFTPGDPEAQMKAVRHCVKAFARDAREVCQKKGLSYPADNENVLLAYFS